MPRSQSLPRRPSVTVLAGRKGSLLLEAIVAIAIFAVFMGGIGMSLLIGERSTISGGDRSKATFLAEKTLEGVRSIARTDFTGLTPGLHGIRLSSTTGKWELFDQSTTTDGFVQQVNILKKDTAVTTKWYEVRSTVSWAFGDNRNGSVQLTTYVTDWHGTSTIGNWGVLTPLSDISVGSGLKHIVVADGYAYITANDLDPLFAQGEPGRPFAWLPKWLFGRLPSIPAVQAAYSGPGLYVYDVSNPSAPVRVSSSFSLGSNMVAGYQLAINDKRLYVLTSDPSSELKVYDITSPTAISSPIAQYDVPGNGIARSINFFHNSSNFGFVPTRQIVQKPILPMCLMSALVPKAQAQGVCNNNRVCEQDLGEAEANCIDCKNLPNCGDSTCDEPPETTVNCPSDCLFSPPSTYGNTIIIATSDGNLYTVLLRDDNTMTLLDSANIDPGNALGDNSITGIALSGNSYTYLSTKHDLKELLVMDLTQPNDIKFPIGPGSPEGINESLPADATVAYAFGSWIMLGRKQGSNTDPTAHELKLYPSEPPVPIDLESARYMDVAGPVLSGVVDVSGTYAFVGTDTQVLAVSLAALSSGGNPSTAQHADIGRPVPGVFFWKPDASTSYLYAVTGDDGTGNGHLLIYKPG